MNRELGHKEMEYSTGFEVFELEATKPVAFRHYDFVDILGGIPSPILS
jgi:hypothetical protein